MDIKGKVFIVTGGASGLGEGTARMPEREGGVGVTAAVQADKGRAVAKAQALGNEMLDGEVIRLDGAIRLAPR